MREEEKVSEDGADLIMYEVYWQTLDGCSMGQQMGAGIQSEFFHDRELATLAVAEKAQVVNIGEWVAMRELRIHIRQFNPLIFHKDLVFMRRPSK